MKIRSYCLDEYAKAVRHTKEHAALVLNPYAAVGWILTTGIPLEKFTDPTWYATKVKPILDALTLTEK